MQKTEKKDLWGIEWPVTLGLRDKAEWDHNVNVVKMLASMGTITRWLKGRKGKDTYTCMPYFYEIDGVQIQFLPHWGYYTVASVNLNSPCSKEDVKAAITAVKKLIALGLAEDR